MFPRRLIPILALLVCLLLPGATKVDVSRLYKLQSAFLLNFLRFAEWPADALEDGDPLEVAIVSADPLASAFAETADGRAIGGRPIAVHPFDWPRTEVGSDTFRLFARALSGHEMVVLESSDRHRVEALSMLLSRRPVLLVSDRPEGIDAGTHLAFELRDGRVVFHASRPAIEMSRVGISAQLLRLAEVHD